jgi:hypothetical protein
MSTEIFLKAAGINTFILFFFSSAELLYAFLRVFSYRASGSLLRFSGFLVGHYGCQAFSGFWTLCWTLLAFGYYRG